MLGMWGRGRCVSGVGGGGGGSGYVGWGGDGSTLHQLATLTSSHTLANSSLRVGMPGGMPGGMLGGLGGGGSVNGCAWRGRRGMKNGGRGGDDGPTQFNLNMNTC